MSVNNLLKINSKVLTTWAGIMGDLEALIIKSGAASDAGRQRMEDLCQRAGLPMERVQLLPPDQFLDFMSFFNHAHLGLDPFPYNGGTTTVHTLWMGVPVVTLAGDRSVSRMGESILDAIGLGELIATTSQEYVEIATSLATDRHN